MKLQHLTLALTLLGGSLATPAAHAYVTYFGEDMPGTGAGNSTAAEQKFLAALDGDIFMQDFEGFSYGPRKPSLVFDFNEHLQATMSGGDNLGVNNARDGRYSVGDGTEKYWQAPESSSSFSITFNQSISGFGFYGIDIGDFGAALKIRLSNGLVFDINHMLGNNGSTSGSLLYFGLVADSPSEYFTSIEFFSDKIGTGPTDYFGFDNMTVAWPGQQVSEPGGWALLGLGMIGLGWRARQTRQTLVQGS